VRATAIVLKAELAGNRPPGINIMSLSGNSKFPDFAEVKKVLNMQYLVRCIEYMYFNSTHRHWGDQNPNNLFEKMKYGSYPSERRRFPECLKEGIPGAEDATIDSFRGSFYRAMYRLLIAGAVLTGAYMDPLFRAREEGNAGFHLRNGYTLFQDDCWEQIVEMDVSEQGSHEDDDLPYIRRSPVYNYDITDWSDIGQWKYREYEAIFGPFASWIVEDGRNRQHEQSQNPAGIKPDWAESSDDVGAVRELMLLMVAYDHFNSKLENKVRDRNGNGPGYLGNRTVSIVRFGVFKVEKITMPTTIEDLKSEYLFAEFHPCFEDSAGKDIPYQFDVWWACSGILDGLNKRWAYNRWNRENPGPPPMLELWHFALRRYLNLGFRKETFWMPRKPMIWECTWWKEVGRGEIFLNPNWAVVQRYQPGTISWDHQS
jgi:hypothetical protein